MLFYWFLTYHILKAKRPKYQKLLPPAKPSKEAPAAA